MLMLQCACKSFLACRRVAEEMLLLWGRPKSIKKAAGTEKDKASRGVARQRLLEQLHSKKVHNS